MRRPPRAIALFIAVSLCLAAVFAWWPAKVPTYGSVAAARIEQPAPASRTPAGEAEIEPPIRAESPAPVTGVAGGASRLADLAPMLQARADAGDAQAACRLGIGLLQCTLLSQHSSQFMDRLAASEQRHDQAGRWDAADDAARLLLRLTEIRSQCDGIPPSLVAAGGDYLRKAALAGHPDALVRYVRGEGLGPGFGFLGRPEFEQWRREAPVLLARELERGNASAVLLALTSHARDFGTLSNITPPDAEAAATALALARRLFGDRAEHLVGRLTLPADAARLAAAEARAAELHERLFAGETRDFNEAARGLVPLHNLYGSQSWPLPDTRADPATACRTGSSP